MPDFLVSDYREPSPQGTGPVRVGMMRGGLVFEQIGNDIQNASTDPSMSIAQSLDSLVVRFMGQIWTNTENTASAHRAIRVYDEGGIDDWPSDPTVQTAKGCVGANPTNVIGPMSSLIEVLTEQRAYLCGTYNAIGSADVTFWRYNPDANVLDIVDAIGINNWPGPSGAVHGIAHDGLVYWIENGGMNIFSFDPVTGQSIFYNGLDFGISGGTTSASQRRAQFVTLHDRLFVVSSHSINTSGENSYIGRICEFAFGVWQQSGSVDTNMGGSSGWRFAIFKLSANKVLLIGPGSEDAPEGGIVANVLTTVGDATAGALQNAPGTIATTNAIIPLALRPITGGYGGPGGFTAARCYGTTVTDDPLGTIRHFLYIIPSSVPGETTVPTMYEVFDDVTPIAIINQTPQMDSRFSFPGALYGGGAQSGGIDGSTRYVSVQARGWAKGNLGVQIKISAHGDAMVLAHRGIAGGPFTPGETITGGTSSATAILIGDGANEGLFLRDVVGTFVADEVVTGGTSSATATLNTVLLHNGVAGLALAVGEVVTGQSSSAFATITHVGLGGPGEQLVKVGAVTNGPFTNGEVIEGGTTFPSTATLSAVPRGFHGGAADKTIRARFFDGKGIPSGFATFVANTGIGCTVSKGTGPSSSDELINVIADGAPGDTPISFEWDFLTDGIDPISVAQMLFEIDRT